MQPPDAPSNVALRLLSFNIQAGTRTSRYRDYFTQSWKQVLPHEGRQRNLDQVARFLSDYDVVGLQEADGGSLRSGFRNQTEFLAESAGFPYWSHQSNRRMAKVAEPSNGLLTRFVPQEVHDHKLPGPVPGRGALWVRYGTGADALIVIVAHLALGQRARAIQLGYLGELVEGSGHVVLMGDLNTPGDSTELREFMDRTGLVQPGESHPTFPSWSPRRRLDHILISPSLELEHSEVVNFALSDHLPVSATIRVPASCLQ